MSCVALRCLLARKRSFNINYEETTSIAQHFCSLSSKNGYKDLVLNQKSFISTDNYIQPTDSTIFSYKRGFFAELLLINDFLTNDSLGKNELASFSAHFLCFN